MNNHGILSIIAKRVEEYKRREYIVHMNDSKLIPYEATQIILESIADGVFTVDLHWRITTFNRAAELITGVTRKEAIGRFCWEVLRSNMCERDCALKRTMAEEKSFVSSDTSIVNSDKKMIPITVSTSVLRNSSDEIIGGVEIFRDHSLVEELRRELSGVVNCGDMVSNSPEMLRLFSQVEQIAESGSTVLIRGETGTGKELLARAIHFHSPRKNKPFITVNCGALPDSLLESELFGHKAGAFTDAKTDKKGVFEQANQGTVFLDELGETSQQFQVKLLRVLEDSSYSPLGANHSQRADVRIIAATHRNLREMVGEGTFRQDLFYRINVMEMLLPPLRERREDIGILVEHFREKLNRIKNRSVQAIDQGALQCLLDHDYPGNIRELENIIEHGFVLCTGDTISINHLPAYLNTTSAAAPLAPTASFEEAEKSVILQALKENGYNRSAAAKALNIHKSTLFRKIQKYQITLPTLDGRNRHKIQP